MSGGGKRFAVLFYFISFIYLNNLYSECGARTYGPKIKSHMLFQLNQLGSPSFAVLDELPKKISQGGTFEKSSNGRR